jgi:lycopene beta-cyclase
VEDTRYSDNACLNERDYREQVLEYCRDQGWAPRSVVRVERGVLPVVLDGDIGAFWNEPEESNPRSGVRAALFHPTTGYSLPEAVRLADTIRDETVLSSANLYRLVRDRSIRKWRRDGFYRLINRMMFRAAKPTRRYLVLERFYRLPQPLIERFYADRLTRLDRLRILSGRPPVPLRRALGCLRGSGAGKSAPAAARGSLR